MKHNHVATWRSLAAALLVAASMKAASALSSQPRQTPCGTITIAAASDLADAMNEMTTAFEQITGCNVRVSTGSSGNFLTQIENGAPFDVFFSADIEYPRKLESEGLAAPGSTYLYAIGKIVLWVRDDSRLDITRGFAALRDAGIQKMAIANPQHAPYGRAAEQALRNAGVYDAIRDHLVLGENISQAAQFVESGNADIEILALSLAVSAELKSKGRYWLPSRAASRCRNPSGWVYFPPLPHVPSLRCSGLAAAPPVQDWERHAPPPLYTLRKPLPYPVQDKDLVCRYIGGVRFRPPWGPDSQLQERPE